MSALLEVRHLRAGYGDSIVLDDVSFDVNAGSVVCLLGANGAGKTTTMAALTGLLQPFGGTATFNGDDLLALMPHRRVGAGLALCPEGRQVFPNLTVEDNLLLGAYTKRARSTRVTKLNEVYSLFPRLSERRGQQAGLMSGGEQQMLEIGRALMSNPKFLMLDEPSLGIAPRLISTIFEKIVEINRNHGITILLVEQNANLALEISSYAYVLETGRIVMQGESSRLRSDPQLKVTYLGG